MSPGATPGAPSKERAGCRSWCNPGGLGEEGKGFVSYCQKEILTPQSHYMVQKTRVIIY